MLLPPFPFFLFCLSSSTPRDLPSFPTRRSSDLLAAHRIFAARVNRFASIRDLPALQLPGAAVTRVSLERSEEHTSELQSRFDLVCRLLLEKKKNNFISSLNYIL